jgi:signal transduction histidine kinase
MTILVAPDAVPGLKQFLERPAKFAETSRPMLVTQGAKPGTEVMIFAQGQAGIVSGYFVLVRSKKSASAALPAPEAEVEPSLLGRVSRGLRRPLNTIVGFADLIRSSAFGPIHNPRYLEYARDIKAAGMEITALVDELDDFVRLRDGRYLPRLTDVDLVSLLNASIVRVRGQASKSRVLLRSAISERLPRVKIDRAALGQAVLNLLASAIDQTPVGGSVIFSAQQGDDGSIAIHVRDSGPPNTDPAERFVVFRDEVDRDGTVLSSVRSTVGLALTRSLLEVNQCALSIDPAGGTGTLFSLVIPASLVTGERRQISS